MGVLDLFRRAPDVETRETASYADEVVRLLQSRAGPSVLAGELHTLALEAAAGTVGRAFAAATLEGGIGPELEPHLELIGRSFVRRGESLLVPRRGATFSPASSWTVRGRGGPWSYEVTVADPDGTLTWDLPARRVLHFRTAAARSTPWRGRSALDVADTGARLIGYLEGALADEAGGPRGQIVPVPVNPDDDALSDIKEAIRTLAGRVFLAESQRTGWGDADARYVSQDWRPQRLGADPPEGLVKLFVEHRRAVLAACGVPPEILGGSDSAGRREAWRIFVYGTLAPFGYTVEREVAEKRFGTVRIKWDRLRASDISGRSRAYAGLVAAGMTRARAETLVGFEG